jgi:hypothetical protein
MFASACRDSVAIYRCAGGLIALAVLAGCREPAAKPKAAAAVAGDVAVATDSAWLAPRAPEVLKLGGCGRACESPESAVSFFLTQLSSPDAATLLRPLVDWSLLVVDDRDLGTQWATQWADPNLHAAREAEISKFLAEWTSWPGRSVQADGWGRMRGSGIQLRLKDEKTAVVRLRHPQLRDDTSEPVWQLLWQQRGAEWLLSGIDHHPSQRGAQ